MPDQIADADCDWIIKYRSWHLKNNLLHISCLTEKGWESQVIINAVSDNIWNYFFIPPDADLAALPYSTHINHPEPKEITIEENASGLIVRNEVLRLVINRHPWKMIFYNEMDEIVFSESAILTDLKSPSEITPLGYYSENNIQYTTQSFATKPDEIFFGFGEHSTVGLKSSQKIILKNENCWRSDSVSSNKNIPFFFSNKGYGLFINSSSQIEIENGIHSAASCKITNRANFLDLFLIIGNSPDRILRSYSYLTGSNPVHPKWTYGLCISATDEYLSTDIIDEIVNEFEKESIPNDVLLICPTSFHSRKFSSFMKSTDLYMLFAHIHSRKLKISLRIHPYIPVESELYHIAKENNFLVRNSRGEVYILNFGDPDNLPYTIEFVFRCRDIRGSSAAFIDFTNEAACSWYKGLYGSFLQAGADILSIEYNDDIPDDAQFYNGSNGIAIHNLYSTLFNRVVSDLTSEVKPYRSTFTRSGSAGVQRYSICWSHNTGTEFNNLGAAIRRGISAGLSGIPFWMPDIDLIAEKLTRELLCRWIQFLMLCSHSKIPGNILLTMQDEQIILILRKSAKLRYSLFPYLYSLSYESSKSGIPLMRSMFLSFPDDPNTLDKDLQFMLGPAMLVSPVYNENNEAITYLPEGEWINYNTGERHKGITNIKSYVPLDQIPIYIKSGSIIPMIEASTHIPEEYIDSLILCIYPDVIKSAYVFYEDEGVSEFTCHSFEGRVTITVKGIRQRAYKLRIFGVNEINNVLITSEEIRKQLTDYSFQDMYVEIILPKILNAQIIIS